MILYLIFLFILFVAPIIWYNYIFKKNDKVVIVAGTPPNQEAATNLLRVMKIGE